jgi:hypothetical protein
VYLRSERWRAAPSNGGYCRIGHSQKPHGSSAFQAFIKSPLSFSVGLKRGRKSKGEWRCSKITIYPKWVYSLISQEPEVFASEFPFISPISKPRQYAYAQKALEPRAL